MRPPYPACRVCSNLFVSLSRNPSRRVLCPDCGRLWTFDSFCRRFPFRHKSPVTNRDNPLTTNRLQTPKPRHKATQAVGNTFSPVDLRPVACGWGKPIPGEDPPHPADLKWIHPVHAENRVD